MPWEIARSTTVGGTHGCRGNAFAFSGLLQQMCWMILMQWLGKSFA